MLLLCNQCYQRNTVAKRENKIKYLALGKYHTKMKKYLNLNIWITSFAKKIWVMFLDYIYNYKDSWFLLNIRKLLIFDMKVCTDQNFKVFENVAWNFSRIKMIQLLLQLYRLKGWSTSWRRFFICTFSI